jgi:hypothetical protein
MTLRDPSRIELRPLSSGDLAVLELLLEDRDGDAQGVPREAVELAGGTRFPGSLMGRLRAHGYVIGVTTGERYELGHAEPASTRAPGVGRPSPPESDCSGVQASGALVDLGQPRLFDSAEPHWKAA